MQKLRKNLGTPDRIIRILLGITLCICDWPVGIYRRTDHHQRTAQLLPDIQMARHLHLHTQL